MFNKDLDALIEYFFFHGDLLWVIVVFEKKVETVYSKNLDCGSPLVKIQKEQ